MGTEYVLFFILKKEKRMVITVKKEICDKNIDWFFDSGSEQLKKFLIKRKYKIVRDVIKDQKNIPQKYFNEIKVILGFEMFGVKR